MKFTLYIAALLISTLFLSACATNEHDAAIAESAASIERTKELAYAEGIKAANTPKKLWEIKGEVRCTPEQITNDDCGVISYNANAQSVAPQRDKNWVDGVEAVGNTLVRGAEALTPIVLAKEVKNIVKEVGKSAGSNTYNDGSFNSHAEANQANQQTTTTNTTTETVSGIKANGNVDQSQHNQNNPSTTTNTDNNSVNDSNNGGNDNSSTEVTEPVTEPATDGVE